MMSLIIFRYGVGEVLQQEVCMQERQSVNPAGVGFRSHLADEEGF